MRNGVVSSSGELGLRVIRPRLPGQLGSEVFGVLTLQEIVQYGFPLKGMARELRRWKRSNLQNLWRGVRWLALAKMLKLPIFYGALELVKISDSGPPIIFGLVSLRVVTNVGVAMIVDEMDAATSAGVALDSFNYHGIGTGSTAEAATDTALVTELTTQYSTDNTRATGVQSQPAANQYRTVATNTVDAAVAIVEHGVLSQAAVGGGTLLDRSVFAVVNLASGESLQSTYTFTATAGG